MPTIQPLTGFARRWLISRPTGCLDGEPTWQQRSICWLGRPSAWMNLVLSSLGSWLLTTAVSTVPVLGAEQISFFYGPLQFSLAVDSLAVFAKEGRVVDEFAFYARQMNPQQQAVLRELLSGSLAVNPTTVSQFTYSSVGETILWRLGRIVQTESGLNGFYALRAASILAAADPDGLTVLNILRRFPVRSIQIDLNQGLAVTQEFTQQLRQREDIIAAIQQLAAIAAAQTTPVDFSQRPLSLPGRFAWRRETLILRDGSRMTATGQQRDRVFPADIYLPLSQGNRPIPVIAISHGAASDRSTFAYLAQHLASHGFAVAVLSHPGSDAQRFQQFLAGLAKAPEPIEWLDRPLDVKYMLDELQRRSKSDPIRYGQLDLQQVGVIGQSLGGYTALALVGAQLDLAQLHEDCQREDITVWNISLLIQCRLTDIPPTTVDLHDPRVKAAIAINPVTSSIFGRRGMSQIQVPVMLVAGSTDIVTPAVTDQIYPFTWLTTPDKYLVIVENGTHFSPLGESTLSQGALPSIPTALLGPEPATVRRYLRAFSLAFAQAYVADRPKYQQYLSASYAKAIERSPLRLSLLQSLTISQLTTVLNSFHQSHHTDKKPSFIGTRRTPGLRLP